MEGLTGRGDRCPQASLGGSTRPASAGLQMLGHGPRVLLSPVSPRVSPTGSRFIPTLTFALTATKPRKEGWGGPGGRSVSACWGLTF